MARAAVKVLRAPVKPSVYIAIEQSKQEPAAETIKDTLVKRGFFVPATKSAGGIGPAPAETVVKYFRFEDKKDALAIINILKALKIGVNPTPQKAVDNDKRPKHFEILLGN